MDISDELLNSLKIDLRLISKFFITFSRFEYALKRAGYIKPNNEVISIDWDRFTVNVESSYDSIKDKKIKTAIEYLNNNPPNRQITNRSRSLTWKPSKRESKESEVRWILRLIRTVRNNLFHGGKFPYSPVEEPARNTELIRNSLVIINTLIELDDTVRDYFRKVE